MDDGVGRRWGAASGLVAVAAGAVALAFERGAVSPAAPPAEIAAFYARNGPAQLTQSLLFIIGLASTPHGQVTPALIAVADAVFVLANLPLAVMLLAAGVVSWRTRALPRWLGLVALVAAAAHAVLAGTFAVVSGPLAPDGWLSGALYPAFVLWLVPAAIIMIARSGS